MAEEIAFKVLVDDDASRDFKKIGDSAEDAGESMGKMDAQSKHLSKSITETEEHLKGLIAEFDKTGDKELFKGIRKDRSTLSFLTSVRKQLTDLDDDGKKAGKNLLSGISDGLGGLPSELKGAMIVAGGVAAVALAPIIGAAVGGAVLGGVGVGGIVGGIALAAQDSRVKGAFADLGADILGDLQSAGQPFVGPVLRSIEDLRSAGRGLIADLNGPIEGLARVTQRLAGGLSNNSGLVGFLHELEPGLTAALEAAQPLVRVLADELPNVGYAISQALEDISGSSDGAAEGLATLLYIVEDFIVGAGQLVSALSDMYEGMVDLADTALQVWDIFDGAISGVGGLIHTAQEDVDGLKDSIDTANSSTGDFTAGLGEMGYETRRTKDDIAQLAAGIDDLFGKIMGLDEAQLHYQQGLAKLAKELTDGKRTLADNSEEGLKNREAVLAQIEAIERLREAEYKQTGNIDISNQHYVEHVEQLQKTLLQMGYNKREVEALTAAYLNLPKTAATTVLAPGLDQVIDRFGRLLDLVHGANGQVYFRVADTGALGTHHDYRAGGGDVQAGRDYVVGENGPELLRIGASGHVYDAATTRAMTASASASGPVPVLVGVDVRGGEDDFVRMIRKWVIGLGGGDVQTAFGTDI